MSCEGRNRGAPPLSEAARSECDGSSEFGRPSGRNTVPQILRHRDSRSGDGHAEFVGPCGVAIERDPSRWRSRPFRLARHGNWPPLHSQPRGWRSAVRLVRVNRERAADVTLPRLSTYRWAAQESPVRPVVCLLVAEGGSPGEGALLYFVERLGCRVVLGCLRGQVVFRRASSTGSARMCSSMAHPITRRECASMTVAR
jgi:hypothetical protein